MIVAPDYINSWGYALLFGSKAACSGKHGVEFLRHAGYSLFAPRFPSSVRVVDETGERVGDSAQVPEDVFWQRLDADESLLFTSWSTTGDDLSCHFRRGRWGWKEEYSIGNALRREAEQFVERLVDRFVQETRDGESELLVVDWGANAEDVDWDDFWQGNASYDGPMPDVIGIPHRLVSQFDPQPAAIASQDLPGHTLFIRQHR